MTDIEILHKRPAGLPWPIGSATLLARGGDVSVLPEDYKWREGDRVVIYKFNNGVTELIDVALTNYLPESATAEEWLALQGYSSIRLVALMDIENKLRDAEKTSAKLTTVRAWIDGILASFIQNPAPQSGWPEKPYSFEETTLEAFLALNDN